MVGCGGASSESELDATTCAVEEVASGVARDVFEEADGTAIVGETEGEGVGDRDLDADRLEDEAGGGKQETVIMEDAKEAA